MTLEPGTPVLVKDYRGRIVRLVVVEASDDGVMVTNEGEYNLALREGREPMSVGVAKESVSIELGRPA